MGELGFLSAVELVGALRRREVSSRELLEYFLARLDAHNPSLNAVITLDVERAAEAAAEADESAARGEWRGPLHGLPMTVKDAIETAGLRTTCGAPELADHVPTRDADAVARLRAAGAVIFGKTNLPRYADDFQTYNQLFGTTNNPWDVGRGAGGSSGGAAAALAAGLTGFELGSDIGGSVRNPAHFCGVFGLKPTWGIVPVRGHIPGPPGSLTNTDIGTLGPMGRSAADLDLGLDVLTGPSGLDAVGWRLELPPPRHRSLGDYRVAAWLDDEAAPVDVGMRAVLEAAVDGLRGAGAKVDDAARPSVRFAEAAAVFRQLLVGAIAPGLPDHVFARACAVADQPVADDEPPIAAAARFLAQRHRQWLFAHERRERQRAAWAQFFGEVDVLLCPVMPMAAFPHDHSDNTFLSRTLTINGQQRPYNDATNWCGIFGVAYLPAASVPVGFTAEGLPVGIQVVGPHLEDRTVTAFARHIGEVLGGFVPPPGY